MSTTFQIWQPDFRYAQRPDPMDEVLKGITTAVGLYSTFNQIQSNNERLKMEKEKHDAYMALSAQNQALNELKIQEAEMNSSDVAMQAYVANKNFELRQAQEKIKILSGFGDYSTNEDELYNVLNEAYNNPKNPVEVANLRSDLSQKLNDHQKYVNKAKLLGINVPDNITPLYNAVYNKTMVSYQDDVESTSEKNATGTTADQVAVATGLTAGTGTQQTTIKRKITVTEPIDMTIQKAVVDKNPNATTYIRNLLSSVKKEDAQKFIGNLKKTYGEDAVNDMLGSDVLTKIYGKKEESNAKTSTTTNNKTNENQQPTIIYKSAKGNIPLTQDVLEELRKEGYLNTATQLGLITSQNSSSNSIDAMLEWYYNGTIPSKNRKSNQNNSGR